MSRNNKREGMDLINKRAAKVESAFLKSLETTSVNPMNTFQIRQTKLLAFIALESTHNTLFHFIETVKVRGQARNLVSGDISNYFKNQVEKKPLISGVISGFTGSVAGAFVFLSVHNLMTH
jgi:ABC-type uncharacterized transport system permease subunit